MENTSMSKIYEIYECQECPHYQKYPRNEKTNEPDFYCRRLKKVVDPFLIDDDCPLNDV